jgi:hypothetical protein
MVQHAAEMTARAQQGVTFTSEEVETILSSLQNITPKNYDDNNDGDDVDNDDDDDDDSSAVVVDWDELRAFLIETAHLSHKDWTRTGANAQRLDDILHLGQGLSSTASTSTSSSSSAAATAARQVLERILVEGQWNEAVQHATNQNMLLEKNGEDGANSCNPWVVLVTGVNGIRKTTSMHQPWFPQLLQEALVEPTSTKTSNKGNNKEKIPLHLLPCGSNSFFRQLDHMICTLCNEEFALLYSMTAQKQLLSNSNPNDDDDIKAAAKKQKTETKSSSSSGSSSSITADTVQLYSDWKAAIFARFRTLCELLGVVLLRQAQNTCGAGRGMNCMLETSGRDVAMFHYVDAFFPTSSASTSTSSTATNSDDDKKKEDDNVDKKDHNKKTSGGYNKLALHFVINDLTQAQESVDQRMIREIEHGIQAVSSTTTTQHDTDTDTATGGGNVVWDVIYTNQGGPYGSDVLPVVQQDSDQVWNDQVANPATATVGQDWYKATIQIHAHGAAQPWTARAVLPDGTLGTEFAFER